MGLRLQYPIRSVLFCCSLCILLVHATFTRLYVFEYKFNNMDDDVKIVL